MLNLKHGGHILKKDDDKARELNQLETFTLASKTAPNVAQAIKEDATTPFDYLFTTLAADAGSHLPDNDPAKTVAALTALGEAMVEQQPPAAVENSTIPPVYTYWGQFIDHDMTANTDRDSAVSNITKPDLKPLSPTFVTQNLRNLRRPGLDLDSVYGDGPTFGKRRSEDAGFYDGVRFRLGKNHVEGIRGERIPSGDDLDRDLPRVGALLDAGVITLDDLSPEQRENPAVRTLAFIGDSRNDENLIIAQFHLAFLRFHNKVVDRLSSDKSWRSRHVDVLLFERARQLVRWHYQWLVVHDFLKTVTLPGIVDKVLLSGPKHYAPRGGQLFMPLEFSVAGYRYGHSMVRGAYDHNRNFGNRLPGQGEGPPIIPSASFNLLFGFTGNGFSQDPDDPAKMKSNPFLGQGPTLPFNWIIEWDRFTDKGSARPNRFARKIDTHIALPLTNIINEGNSVSDPIKALLKHLARRNLVRGYLLSIPTGQSVAQAMGVTPLTEAELRQDNSDAINAALDQGGFIERTPLWYYVLKEAQVRANGNSLGELGSRIICETIIGLLRFERSSYLNQRGGWDPSEGVKLDNGDSIVTIRDFLNFTGVPG